MANHFHCKFIFTSKCIDKEYADCDKCPLKDCNSCESSWSSNTCSQCKFNK